MGGFHILDLIVVVAIALLIVGPKAVQSLSHKAGKGVGQAKNMKDKIMSELPIDDISEISNTVSKFPTSPQQAVQKLLLPKQESKKPEAKNEGSPSSSTPVE